MVMLFPKVFFPSCNCRIHYLITTGGKHPESEYERCCHFISLGVNSCLHFRTCTKLAALCSFNFELINTNYHKVEKSFIHRDVAEIARAIGFIYGHHVLCKG